ncbi:hypothetical protein LSM04_003055 [Trypanosoma melophagium]|uniref:uncharacterized protein n=1 Tax=Trypanosoma melophagium TaxID=715481 RepID=UPI00351A56AF|nr:hypothetical protein LSM04_003055 [Trypanosoma melophagium]
MKSRTWVAQTHSSPRPGNYITTDNIETTSGIVYEEPLFTRVCDGGNTSQTHESKDTMEGISTKGTREQDRRWQLEKSRWRSTRQKAVLQPWHHLEQDYEQLETQLLKGRYPNYFFDIQSHHDGHQDQAQHQISYVSEAEPTVASMLVVGSKQNSIKRQRSQTGTPMKVNSPVYETNVREIKEGNNEDFLLRQTPPPPPPQPPQPLHSLSPASPFYLDKKTGGYPGEGVSGDSMRLLPTGASVPMPSKIAGPSSSCALPLSTESLQLQNVNTQKGTVRGKNGHNILSKSNDFMAVSPSLYISTSPPATFAADVTPDPRFEQSNEKHKETEKEGDQSNRKKERKIPREHRAVRAGLTTPSVPCLLQSPPWETVEQRTPLPPPKNRMILTPPRPSLANLSTNFDEVSSVLPVFATKELVARKYQESCTPCTPGKENTTSLNSPSRPLDSIIDTRQGLIAHYKRANGLKTPVVPLLLKNT